MLEVLFPATLGFCSHCWLAGPKLQQVKVWLAGWLARYLGDIVEVELIEKHKLYIVPNLKKWGKISALFVLNLYYIF